MKELSSAMGMMEWWNIGMMGYEFYRMSYDWDRKKDYWPGTNGTKIS
jgi:hypothetical protein